MKRQLLTLDTLVPQSKKGTAKCDKSCELQNSVNHRVLERKLHCWVLSAVCLFECQPKTIKYTILVIGILLARVMCLSTTQ